MHVGEAALRKSAAAQQFRYGPGGGTANINDFRIKTGLRRCRAWPATVGSFAICLSLEILVLEKRTSVKVPQTST